MPKPTRQRRRHQPRHNPLPQSSTPSTNVSDKTVPIVVSLSSTDASDREGACLGLARIFADCDVDPEVNGREVIAQCLQGGVIASLLERLIDPELSVRAAAIGALRNLSLVGGDEVCEEIVRRDCLTPLLVVLQKIHTDLQQAGGGTGTAHETQLSARLSIVEQSIALLWNLVESCDPAVEVFSNSEVLIPVVMQYLHPGQYSDELVLTVANFINVVTEDNPICINQVSSSPDNINRLVTLMSDGAVSPRLRALIGSVLYNIRNRERPVDAVRIITPVLVATFSADIGQELVRILQQLSDMQATENGEAKATMTRQLVDALKQWKQKADASLIVLETMANMCAIEMDTSGGDQEDVELDAEVTATLSSSGLLDKILPVCDFPPLTMVAQSQALPFTASYMTLARNLQLRALDTLSNIVMHIGSAALQDVASVLRIIMTLTKTALQRRDEEALTRCSCLLSNLLRRFPSNNGLEAELLEVVVPLVNSGNEEAKIHGTEALGILGQQPAFASQLSGIGRTLVSMLTDASLAVVVEALNSAFDIFAEEEHNAVVKDIALIDVLVNVKPRLDNQVAQGRDDDEMLAERIEECAVNLQGFLDYKSGQAGV